MSDTPRHARVQSFIGRTEWRPVLDVREWRVESAVDDGAIVVTLTTAQGQDCFYRLSATDAEDITAVLGRLVASQPGTQDVAQGASKPIS